jgi:transposase
MSGIGKEFTGRTGKTAITATIIIDPVIYVAIDVAKYYHKAMIFDLDKNVLEPAFTFDISKEGFSILLERIAKQTDRYRTKSVVIGMEATGHYHETLAQHLRAAGFKVLLFNPYATFKTRILDIDYVKTDEIDLKAIGQAMLLGKGREMKEEADVYKELKLLTRFRRAKNQSRAVLKNQMLRDLDRLWPGLLKECRGKTGLFTNLWESKIARALLNLDLLPQQVATMPAAELLALLKSQSVKGIGAHWANKIIKHATGVLPCEGCEAVVHQQVTQSNLKLLESLDNLIGELDRQTAILLHETPGVYLLSIQGISTIRVAEFIAEIGNPYKYHRPQEWVKLAGINASRYQSGTADRKVNPITKVGNSYLRGTLFTIARDIARWEPLFVDLKNKLCAKGKHIQVAYGAVANKFLRVAFSMMLRKSNFLPDYENKKEKKCPTKKAA